MVNVVTVAVKATELGGVPHRGDSWSVLPWTEYWADHHVDVGGTLPQHVKTVESAYSMMPADTRNTDCSYPDSSSAA
jgi:hypothetical protein